MPIKGQSHTMHYRDKYASKPLTPIDLLILQSLADGLTTKEMTFGAEGTLDTYRTRLLWKTGCRTSCELVAYGFRNGLIK